MRKKIENFNLRELKIMLGMKEFTGACNKTVRKLVVSLFENFSKYNKISIQKKFYCENQDNKLKIQVLIKSKLKNYLTHKDFEEKIRTFNKKINLNSIILNKKNFSNFEGFIVICKLDARIKRFDKKRKMLVIVLFNQQFLFENNILFYRIYSILDLNTILFILEYFFINNSSKKEINQEDWKNVFYNDFLEKNIYSDSFIMFIDNEPNIEFLKFKDLEDLIKFLQNIPQEQ